MRINDAVVKLGLFEKRGAAKAALALTSWYNKNTKGGHMVSRIIPVERFDLIIFGGTGDLARRKILPGLFKRFADGQIPEGSRIIGAARTEMDAPGFRDFVKEAIETFHSGKPKAAKLKEFLEILDYVTIDALGETGWPELASKMREDRKSVV